MATFDTSSQFYGLPQCLSGKEFTYSAGDIRDMDSIPGSGRFPWSRKWLPAPVFLPEKSHGPRNLAGYSLKGCKDSDTTEQLHTSPFTLCGSSLVFLCSHGLDTSERYWQLFCRTFLSLHLSVFLWLKSGYAFSAKIPQEWCVSFPICHQIARDFVLLLEILTTTKVVFAAFTTVKLLFEV